MHVLNVRRHSEQNHHLLAIKDVIQGRNLTNVVHAVKPLAIDSHLLFIREFILEKNHISVRNVGKPSARLDTLIYIEESTLERDLTNVKNAEKSSDKAHTLLIIIKFMLQSHLKPSALPHPLHHQVLGICLLSISGIHPHLSILIALIQNVVISSGLFQLSKHWSLCILFCLLQVHSSHYSQWSVQM